MPHRRTVRILLVAVALLAAGCSDDGGDAADDDSTSTTIDRSAGGPSTTEPGEAPVEVADRIRIEVLSSQPDRVTGDDARIRITPKAGNDPGTLRVAVDGRDVTADFAPTDAGGTDAIEGIVTGLGEGTNSLTATDGNESSTLRLRAWPRQGPMISGFQTPLPACATEAAGLGAPTDASCAAPNRVTWRFITSAGEVRDLPDPTTEPDEDIATWGSDDPVPAVVRVEQGVINRSTYTLAVLDRTPGSTDADFRPAWNGRLIVRFADGCGAGHGQGVPGAAAVDPELLTNGYAVVTASFTTGSVQCNDLIASETVMMVRERVVELLGEVELAIGDGTGFGGAMAHLILQNYPTLLDGVVTTDAYADTTTTANQIADCMLLQEYYRSPAADALDERARAAINGHASTATCTAAERDLGAMFDPTACDPAVPAGDVYDAATAPEGLRCTYQDLNIVPFGVDEATGWAHRPVDNVGVQYGLSALNRGTITVEQFLDLNEGIGGLDIDGAVGADRSAVDPLAVQTMYENGRVSAGVGDQRRAPIIDIVHDDDDAAPADLHQALALRARLTRGGPGDEAPGHQIWVVPRDDDDASASVRFEAIEAVDEWLTAIAATSEPDALFTERPSAAVSRCDDGAIRGTDVFNFGTGACIDPEAPEGDPRMVAGALLTLDVIKCELKPVDETDYEVTLSSDQYERLIALYPDGVCDWNQAGVGQTLPTMPDRSFEDAETPADLA